MPPLPKAILFDLDDTLIQAYAQPAEAWTRLLLVFAVHLDAHDAVAIERVRVAVMDASRAFWNDQATAAKWRLDIPQARRLAVRQGLANLGKADETLADEIADAFTAMRRNEYRLYPDAHATVDALRDHMKDKARALGLKNVRINASGCLDRCELGPTVVIYPEGVWYACATKEDIDEVLQTHLVQGGRVERLMLKTTDKLPRDRVKA